MDRARAHERQNWWTNPLRTRWGSNSRFLCNKIEHGWNSSSCMPETKGRAFGPFSSKWKNSRRKQKNERKYETNSNK
jgi:hypothetical protein